MNINSIAIVGAGPAGLAAAYELLHTTKQGESFVGTENGTENGSKDVFSVVVFEQKDKPGGIWTPNFETPDLPVPPQSILDTERYNHPDVIHPKQLPPQSVDNSSRNSPIPTEIDPLAQQLDWKNSGIYPNLFTNIPSRFTRYSYMEYNDKINDKSRPIYPFMSQQELCTQMEMFVEDTKLARHIRFGTKVQNVKKSGDKWSVIVREEGGNSDSNSDNWYQEQFDAVIVANGHYTVPNFPHVPGLAAYHKKYPGSIIHANSYRTPDQFQNKNVLIVGGSISTINMLLYLTTISNSVTVASRGKHKLFPWIDKAVRSEGIISKPPIESIDSDTGKVQFVDGTVASRYDYIIFTTGYHFHYPFLEPGTLEVINPSNSSRVNGLYYNTFSIKDPTLAVVGVTCSTLNFHTIETSAAAIAGVWSGHSKLPDKETQRQWEQKRLEKKGNSTSFHYYTHKEVKQDYVDPLVCYFAKNRPSPLAIDGEHLGDVDLGIETIEKLFYLVKSKQLIVTDDLYLGNA